jgi:hypothetical protein
MNKKIFFVLVSSIVITILFFGCKKVNVVETKPIKDPRTYSWTADTLGYPGSYQTLMSDIWGSSANDVYVVGHNSQNRGLMWHYDGHNWTNVRLITSEGGQIDGAIDLTSIYGFSSTDIYAAGSRIIGYNPNPPPTFIDSAIIIHFDGSTWKQVSIYDGIPLNDIYGSSSNDIWAGGLGKNMFHYNGSTWETDSINISIPNGFDFQINTISSYNSNFYLIGYGNNNTTAESIIYFFKRLKNEWVLQDSFNDINGGNKFGYRLNQSNLPDLYSNGYGIFKYNNSAWSNIFQSEYPFSSMWGTSNNNIFAVSTGGRAFHYNGTDWKQIEQLNLLQINYYAVWTDGTEAFVVGHIFDGIYYKTIIWHGK